jgi:hypothetical protein
LRTYIFTERDRELLENAFKGVRLEGVSNLRKKIKEYKAKIEEDYKLLKEAIAFFEGDRIAKDSS